MSSGVQTLLIVFTLLLLGFSSAEGQYVQKNRTFVVSPDSATIFLDFFTIPESIVVTHVDTRIDHTGYQFEPFTGRLTFIWPQQWTSLPVEIKVQWNVRPVSIPGRRDSPYALTPSPFLTDTDSVVTRYTPPGISGSEYESTLVSSGSITRGIIIGNTRDPGLESGLQFDLQGSLTEQISISASLSDQNAIIQPEGTTQNLREFDQVFIRVQSPSVLVNMGDVDASFKNSGIARLQRRIQGAVVHTDQTYLGEQQVVLSVQRGTFRNMEFRGRDGIQGPYRLMGERGETFIIVVAGTEQVYLDGKLLTRGDDQDYIIDYSIGEITFTGKRLIRSSHRIRVEFQYVSTSYSRSLFAIETDHIIHSTSNIQVGATFIREADAINFGDFSMLSMEDLEVITNAGIDETRMRVSGADSVGYRPDSPYLLYVARDTLVNGQRIEIFEYKPGDPASVYRVRFASVGPGNGSYRRASTGVLGIVYEWVGPNLGNYEPYRQLSSPKQTQLLAVRAGGDLWKGLRVRTEWAGSSYNPNRLSATVGQSNDYMFQGGMELKDRPLVGGALSADASIEYKGADFKVIDRIRDPEFDRLWGLAGLGLSNEYRYQSGLSWKHGNTTSASYQWQLLDREDRNGVRHGVSFESRESGKPYLTTQLGSLKSTSSQLLAGTSSVFDGTIQTGYTLVLGTVFLTPDLYVNVDRELSKTDRDTLRFGHEYRSIQPSIMIQTKGGNTFTIGYSMREESNVVAYQMIPSRIIRTPEVRFQINSGLKFNTDTRIGFQQSDVTAAFARLTGATDTDALSIRSATSWAWLSSGIQQDVLYDINTESRSLQQETYLEVGPEFGQYVWIDLNNDQIKQLEEFFPEQNPNEGTFIRQLLPTDELRPVVALRARWNLKIDPIRWLPDWRQRATLVQWLANTVYTSTIDVRDQSQTESILEKSLLGSGQILQEDKTISGSLNWRQELHILRRNAAADLYVQRNFRKAIDRQINGLQTGEQEEWLLTGIYRFPEAWSVELRLVSDRKESVSERVVGRNYTITGMRVEPALQYSTVNGSRVKFGVVAGRREDATGVGATLFNILQEGTIYLGDAFRILERLEFRTSTFTREVTPALEFELTNASGKGNSWLWNLGMQWDNSEWVRTTVQYDGRTVPGRGIIQSIRVAITAFF
jgi:hypothetical protein